MHSLADKQQSCIHWIANGYGLFFILNLKKQNCHKNIITIRPLPNNPLFNSVFTYYMASRTQDKRLTVLIVPLSQN